MFLAFRKSSNIPSVWIMLSKHGKPSGISLILIGSPPTFLYFDLYLYFAYAAHYVYCLTSAHILNVSFVFPFLARTFSIPWCPGGRAIFGHEVSYDVLRRFRKIADRRLGRGRGEIWGVYDAFNRFEFMMLLTGSPHTPSVF